MKKILVITLAVVLLLGVIIVAKSIGAYNSIIAGEENVRFF